MARVITFDRDAVRSATLQLLRRAREDGFEPSHLIHIASAGSRMWETVRNTMSDALVPIQVRLARSNSAAAAIPSARGLVRHLPYIVTDRLRVAESWLRTRRKRAHAPDIIDVEGLEALGPDDPSCILVLDDAVDSGGTLQIVLEQLERFRASGVPIKTAAIAVTTASTAVWPDYYLHSGVLCRFPWSHDYRG